MSDDAGGCLAAFFLIAVLIFAVFMVRLDGKDAGRTEGYRRGLCEGRGGVEATVGDSIRCIRPPTPVGVDSASTRRAG